MSLNKRSIVLCVGHHNKKRGAQNKCLSLSEWQLCSIFASELSTDLINRNYYIQTLENHTLRQKVLNINSVKPEIAIDIHMNAYDTNESGHLCMYWKDSFFGCRLAEELNNNIMVNRKRPLIAVEKPTQRGAYFLRKTRCISIILELCFIDNDDDMIHTVNNFSHVRQGIIMALNTFFRHYSQPIIERNKCNGLQENI